MLPVCDILLVDESLDEVGSELLSDLCARGFSVAECTSDEVGGTIRFCAQSTTTSFWKLIRFRTPSLILGQLTAIGSKQTRIELEFHSTTRFQLKFIALLFLFLALIQGALWEGRVPRARGSDLFAAIWQSFVPLLSVPILFLIWLKIWQRAQLSPLFYEPLYANIASLFGKAPKVQRFDSSFSRGIHTALSLLSPIVIVLIPLVQRVYELTGQKSSFIALVTSAMFIGVLLTILFNIIGTAALSRNEHAMPILFSSIAIICYGTAPLWASYFVLLHANIISRTIRLDIASPFYAGVFTVELAALCALAALWPLCRLRNVVVQSAALLQFQRLHPELTLSASDSQLKWNSWLWFAYWVASGAGKWCCVLIAASLLKDTFAASTPEPNANLGSPFLYSIKKLTRYWFAYCSWPGKYSELVAKTLVLLYSAPIVVLVMLVFVRNGIFILRYLVLIAKRLFDRGTHSEEQQMLQSICLFAGVRAPLLVIINLGVVGASIEIPEIPGGPPLLLLSSAAITSLSTLQLQAILAHEVGHIRFRHVWLLCLGNFLSRWTFSGEGFLLSCLQAPQLMENQADRFAVEWLERFGLYPNARQNLIEALDIIESQRIVAALQGPTHGLCISNLSPATWLSPELESAVSRYKDQSQLGKWKTFMHLYYNFYVKGWRSTYLYFSHADRTAYISGF